MNWVDFRVHEEHYRDIARDAAQRAVVRRALAEQPRTNTLHRRMLAGLGQRLVNWGWRLQVRFGALQELTLVRTDHS